MILVYISRFRMFRRISDSLSFLHLCWKSSHPNDFQSIAQPLICSEGYADILESLTFKSAAPDMPGDASLPNQNAVLCTDNETYQVRQVHSSNSVFILQPSEAETAQGLISSPRLSAIAKATATLELVHAKPSVSTFLRRVLPVYSGPEEGEGRHPGSGSPSTFSKGLLEDVPFSSGEYNKICLAMCVFQRNGLAWLPTASVLLNVWKSIISAATVRSVDLGDTFSTAALEGVVQEYGHEAALFRAVMNRLASDNRDDRMDGCEDAAAIVISIKI